MEERSGDLRWRLSRRELLRGATATLGLSLLAACAPTPAPAPTQAPAKAAAPAPTQAPAAAAPPKEKAKVTFIWPFAFAQKEVPELGKKFSEEKKTIEVEVQLVPQEQLVPKLTAAYTGGAPPDALAMPGGWIAQFAAGGFLEDLGPRVKSAGLEQKLNPICITELKRYKNTQFGIGYLVSIMPFFWNKQLFSEVGLNAPPDTFDDLLAASRKITDPAKNRFGYYLLGGGAWAYQHWTQWAFGYGGLGVDNTYFDKDGKAIFDSPKHVEGLQAWLDLYQKHKVTPPAGATAGFQDASNAFCAGQIGVEIGWMPQIGWTKACLSPDKWGIFAPPAGPAGRHLYNGADGFILSSGSKNKDAAWEFLLYMLSPQNNVILTEGAGALPGAVDAWSAPYLKDPPFQAAIDILKKLEKGYVSPPRHLPELTAWANTQNPEEIQKALLGQQSAKDAATKLSKILTDAAAKALKA